ncbi:hypothetical protein P2C08_14090 [Xanthomonas perforans]|uniref:hypothetical protein n=1 Tax=Xanthomonas TaxID=338 RepID=UPI000F8F05CE|nr:MULTISPECIES: hypothetical protein [Xanthomonas]MBV6853746.1 hypothetical protein [Xanthomonas campestris pv. mirabilis]NOG24870.1 hypothetical protein [Xanthomonas perforans]
MPAGLQIINSNGFIQIDETYRNLHFKRKGTATTNVVAPGVAGNSSVQIQISDVNAMMLIAVRCSSLVSMTSYNINGSTVTVGLVVNARVGATVDWYAFDTAPQAAAATYGLQVFNASGQIVFDSAHSPMRVVDTYQVNGSAGNTRTYPAGRSYAAVFSPGIYVVPVNAGPEGSNGYAVNLPGVRIGSSSGDVTVAPFQIQGSSGSSFNQTLPSNVMVIDVTHL